MIVLEFLGNVSNMQKNNETSVYPTNLYSRLDIIVDNGLRYQSAPRNHHSGSLFVQQSLRSCNRFFKRLERHRIGSSLDISVEDRRSIIY